MNLFGTAKPQQNTPTQSLQKLRETLDLLEKRETHLQKKIRTELETARRHGTKNKSQAMLALKRKKRYETQLNSIGGMRDNLETQIVLLENGSVQREVMDAMREGNRAINETFRNMTIDDVEDLKDEIIDTMEVATEVTDALAQPIGGFSEFDEDELFAELEELEEEDLKNKLLDIDEVPQVTTKTTENNVSFPETPSVVPSSTTTTTTSSSSSSNNNSGETEEERELRELMASMTA
eukprot:TRINITY_DN2361_c0_g1_i1.p1 TRINITY_DN2361_c0_g1~~TRINITY_DN2361_c0_g1_i1.p1  ORF type:complete len:237 (+),score=94.33 TRINITY_DN2361_c0_g1_i1:284-994(+)